MPENEDYRASKDRLYKATVGTFKILDGPAEWLRSWVVRFRREPEKYYQRKFNRVPTVDQCGITDEVCRYEADEQMKRDRLVDTQIIKILRGRKLECNHYWGIQRLYKCEKEEKDLADATANYFTKYGDLGANRDVVGVYMKQKHRLIWERRQKEREAAGHGVMQTGNSLLFAHEKIIRENLVEELKGQLKSTPDLISNTDNAGNRPIHIAAKYNKVQCLVELLDCKADPNVAGPYELYPLHLAAKYNSMEAAKILLQAKADVLCRDCKQKTPLHHAARKGHQEMLELLLSQKDCPIDPIDEDKLTPLHEAVQLKQVNVAKYLIEKGANLDSRDVSDGSPLQFAAAEGLSEIIKLIITKIQKDKGLTYSQAYMNHVDNEGSSALHQAVQNGQAKVIDLLIQNGADVNIKNNTNYTPLHMAAINGSEDIVKQLVDNGADVECRDGDHMTPAHRCAMYGRTQVLELLLRKGANLNARTSEQMTPLHLSAWKGHLSTLEYLLQHNAKLAASDFAMRTSLHWSVSESNWDILQALIRYGGDALLKAVDQTDQTVAHYAARTGNTMILNLLIRHGVDLGARDQDGRTPLHVAAEFGNYTSIEILIDASKSETNDADSDGRTPLMLSCLNGHFKATQSLLALGADNSVRDENYCTALILAASKGHVKVTHHLIDNLAEVNVCDKLKNTSLHMAAAGGHVDAVCLLLDKNALANTLNSYYKSPLDVALDFDQIEVAVMMMKHRKWQEVMSVRNQDGFTPMKSLIQKAPEAALVLMDNCLKQSDLRKDDMDYSLTYNFQYIDPGPDDPSCKTKRYYALNTMIDNNREDLLSHPLTQALLIMKWRKFNRIVLFGNLFMYSLYVAILLAYTNIVPSIASNIIDDVRSCPIYLSPEKAANESLVNILKQEGQLSNLVIDSPFLYALQLILEISIILLILKELFLLWGQVKVHTKWRYFLNPYTYCNWVMMLSTLVFINPPARLPCETNWRGAWISSLCAWILLISYLQKLDVVGIYFVMFSEVMLSLTKVMLVLILFLMAFSQSFNAVIAQVAGFRDQDFSMLTVLAMTLGEMNYVDVFVESDNFPFTIDSYIVVGIFMLMMPIALVNLLIGIAVGDIDKIQKQAYIKRIGLQVDQINDTETRLPKSIQRKLYQQNFVIKPNREKSTRWAKFKFYVFGLTTSVDFIPKSEKDVTLETMHQLERLIKKNKTQLKQIQSSQMQLQELMKQLCEHFHIDVVNPADQGSVTSDWTDITSRLDLH